MTKAKLLQSQGKQQHLPPFKLRLRTLTCNTRSSLGMISLLTMRWQWRSVLQQKPQR